MASKNSCGSLPLVALPRCIAMVMLYLCLSVSKSQPLACTKCQQGVQTDFITFDE